MTDLASIALALPGVDQGIACAGTSIESRTYRVKQKNFLFVSAKVVRLRLAAAAAEARKFGAEVGAHGWVKLSADALPPAAVMKRWIAESHGLLAGKPPATKSAAKAKKTKKAKKAER